MSHDVIISILLVGGLVLLDFAALRWGFDSRSPSLLATLNESQGELTDI